MSEQERERSAGAGQESGDNYVEVDVTIHGTYIGKVKIKKGATVEELLEAVKKRAEELGMDLGKISEWNILLNDRNVSLTKDGKVKEKDNVRITENSVLVLSKRIVGGDCPACKGTGRRSGGKCRTCRGCGKVFYIEHNGEKIVVACVCSFSLAHCLI